MANKFERLRSHVPAAYKPTVNRFIKGVLEAIATGDDSVSQAILDGKAQLFVSTASQQYLDRLGANVGVERPASLGMPDIDFRDLVPALSFAPKQIREVLYKLLEVWYKPEAVFANMVSTVAEPYSLTDGDTLDFIINREETVNVTFSFQTSDFLDISNATAAEVVNSINKQSLGKGIKASVFSDGISDQQFIRIRTTTPGPFGEVKIAGGTAQNILRFPSSRATAQAIGTEWDVAPVTGDTVRMEYTGVGQNPLLSQVKVGDLIIVSGPFDSVNRGSFYVNDVVLNATVDGLTPGKKYTGIYVEFSNAQAANETITQTGTYDVSFYFPKRHDINAFPRPATLYEVNHKELVVVLPSSATVIGRDERGSAHLHPNTALQTLLINYHDGIAFSQGDTVYGLSTLFMDNANGTFVVGETITGGTSLATAIVSHVINSSSANTIVGVNTVVGGFIVGETITGSVSSATGSFVKTITTNNATGLLDSVLDINRKFGIQDVQGSFLADEGVVGRTEMIFEYSADQFDADEAITTASAIHLKAPWIGDFVVGETITGGTSLATATVNAVIRNKYNQRTTLQISNVVGTFATNEIVTGGISLAFATNDGVIVASGASGIITKLGSYKLEQMAHNVKVVSGVFKSGEIIIGSDSGTKGVVGSVFSAAGVFVSIDATSEYPSPYVFDENNPYTASNLSGNLTEEIEAGQPKSTLSVTTLPEEFPSEPGYFLLDMGTSAEEGPIRYLGKINDNTLIVDPAFIYQNDHGVGSNLRYVRSLEGTTPRVNGLDYATYVTGLAEARIILQELIKSVVAAGVTVRFIVVFPKYLFECYQTNEIV